MQAVTLHMKVSTIGRDMPVRMIRQEAKTKQTTCGQRIAHLCWRHLTTTAIRRHIDQAMASSQVWARAAVEILLNKDAILQLHRHRADNGLGHPIASHLTMSIILPRSQTARNLVQIRAMKI